ncbi:SDR family oxidoreductase [Nocardia xishanensis]|uniref:SDR family oxidoreductase n=1 Tax=Nocardia xishanensis TaxID=238964 RepID=UPI003433083A
MRCVVFGATGYIGGRLVPELLRAGHSVRVVARSPGKLADAPWRDRVEIVRGDVLGDADVRDAVAEQEVLYYLVHSLDRADFGEIDRAAAARVAAAAAKARVRRIIYLGGITPADQPLSRHLASRAEVGQIFLTSPVPALVLRAGVVIGSGSASFEMLRYLTERLPVMVTPRWVRNRVQPIAVRDVLYYLVQGAELAPDQVGAFDIGGPDIVTYEDMMQTYAEAAQLPRRVVVPVPLLTPWLSAQWVNLVTPVPRAIAVPLMESLINDVACSDHAISQLIPDPPTGPIAFREAVTLALTRIRDLDVPTRWSDASPPQTPSDPLPSDPDWAGGSLYRDFRERPVHADPEVLWSVIESVGGEHGWYSFPLAWAVRGWLDRIFGGVGLRRGRRHPHTLRQGEALDWWRVETLERPRLLRLRAEMRVPGRAWLELSVTPAPTGGALYRQCAVFEPRGLAGHAYWHSVAPFHALVFGGMARNITAKAEATKRPASSIALTPSLIRGR